jgi:hypothetical protein
MNETKNEKKRKYLKSITVRTTEVMGARGSVVG